MQSFHHTHQIHPWLVIRWYNEKTTRACRRKEVGFPFWLKRRVKTNAWQESSRSQVQCIERISSPKVLLTNLWTWKIKYSRLSDESEKDIWDEATLRGMEELYKRQFRSRWELFCIESSCRLEASGDRKGVMWADVALKMRWNEQLTTLWILSRRTWGQQARRSLQ